MDHTHRLLRTGVALLLLLGILLGPVRMLTRGVSHLPRPIATPLVCMVDDVLRGACS